MYLGTKKSCSFLMVDIKISARYFEMYEATALWKLEVKIWYSLLISEELKKKVLVRDVYRGVLDW